MPRPNVKETNPFGDDATPAEQKAFSIYQGGKASGPIGQKKDDRVIAAPLDIFKMQPDPTQPRRSMPQVARIHIRYPQHALEEWQSWVFLGIDRALARHYIVARLNGQDTNLNWDALPNVAPFADLIDLAASIKRDGLANPITVVKHDDSYTIETGERRWLAYHALYYFLEDRQWIYIPARIVDGFNAWRQAAENTNRANLTYIARVRQWALLMMQAWIEKGETFQPYDVFDCDRDFYAQVANLQSPDEYGEIIRSACGVTSRQATSNYRKAFQLTPQEWLAADDDGWSQAMIEGASTAVDSPLAKPTTPPRKTLSTEQKQARKFAQALEKFESGAVGIKPKKREQLALQAQWLSEYYASIVYRLEHESGG